MPADVENVVVMRSTRLGCTFKKVGGAHGILEIYWGAYVSTDDEILRSGNLLDVKSDADRAGAHRSTPAQGLDHGHLPAAPADALARAPLRASRVQGDGGLGGQ